MNSRLVAFHNRPADPPAARCAHAARGRLRWHPRRLRNLPEASRPDLAKSVITMSYVTTCRNASSAGALSTTKGHGW